MGGSTRFPLAFAESWARELAGYLTPVCERVEIAGSVRRRKPECGDVELVIVPRFEVRMEPSTQAALFGAPAPTVRTERCNLAYEVLDRWTAAGGLLPPTKNGPRMRSHPGDGLHRPQVDIFCVLPPAEWGAILAIRTGPSDFSKGLMQALRARGLRCENGAVWQGEDFVPTPTEEAFFGACGRRWVAPEERS